MGQVVKDHKNNITYFWAKDFPQLVLQVPDNASGIFLGNAVLDAVLAEELMEVFAAAAQQFRAVYEK